MWRCKGCGEVQDSCINIATLIYWCQSCKGWQRRDKVDSRNTATVCPHCLSVDSMMVSGGEEWCGECGLDPNEITASVDLATLYKGDVRRILEKGGLKPGTRPGRFVRTDCGPNCRYGEKCEQTTKIFAACLVQAGRAQNPFRQEEDSEDMGKRNKQFRREERARKAAEAAAEATAKAQHSSEFRCSDERIFREAVNYGRHNGYKEPDSSSGHKS